MDKVFPSLMEVQVATIRENLHLPPGQALLIVQTKLKFSATFDGQGHCCRQFLRAL